MQHHGGADLIVITIDHPLFVLMLLITRKSPQASPAILVMVIPVCLLGRSRTSTSAP